MIIVRQFTAPVCWASPMQFRPCRRRLPADFFDPFHLSPSLCRAKIIILWNSEKAPPSRSKWPPMPVPLTVTDGKRKVSVCFHSTRVWATVTPTVSHFDCLSFFFFFATYLPYAPLHFDARHPSSYPSLNVTSPINPSGIHFHSRQSFSCCHRRPGKKLTRRNEIISDSFSSSHKKAHAK